jgi:prepilin-type N-terminal cleavage/methylation domain-containing protein/prepilin-type processing-associated H-X9-DG protein
MVRSRWRPRPTAFTLIELLVVIAIIGVLMSLLLPAVQKVREAASRAQCQNNLKQIGLALNNYHEGNGCFPPGDLSGAGTTNHSWPIRVFPYLELGNLHQLYHFEVNWDNDLNDSTNLALNPHQINQFRPAILQCPSAPTKRSGSNNRGPTDYAATNITNQTGDDYTPYTRTQQYANSGVLANVSVPTGGTDTTGYRIADILDGASNTVMVAEDAGRNQHWINGALDSHDVTNGSWAVAWANPGSKIDVRGYSPAAWRRGGGPDATCAVNCINGSEVYSFHQGGANVVMADGSVHFLKATATIQLLRALITRASRETVSPDF